jgi:hypothetical protein
MATVTAKRELIPLSGACRVTCRASKVLKGWYRAGDFAEGEWVVDESRVQGGGHPVLVDIRALEREHRRHGGTEWHPHLAHARNLPHMGTYVDDLRARLRSLEEELDRLKRRGGTGGAALPATKARTRDPDATRTRPAAARARRPSPSPAAPSPRRPAAASIDDILPVRAERGPGRLDQRLLQAPRLQP